jgi:hypothetical protein
MLVWGGDGEVALSEDEKVGPMMANGYSCLF